MQLRYWWRHYVRRADVERSLNRELDAAVALMVADAVRDGVDPGEAHRRANLTLGGVASTKERVRDVLPGSRFMAVCRDARYAVRFLLRRPLFTMTAVGSLALGIGASTAAYSWGRHMFLEYPAGVRRPAQMAAVLLSADGPQTYNIISWPHFQELAAAQTVFSDFAGSFRWTITLATDSAAREATAEFVTGTFFQTVGIRLIAGRGIQPTDDVASGPTSVVLSERVWNELFQRAPDVLGRTVRLNGHPYSVVGIAAAEYEGIEYSAYGRPDVWTALQAYTPIGGTDKVTRRTTLLMTFGRLKDGLTLVDAANNFQIVAAHLSHEPTDTYRVTGARMFPLNQVRVLRFGFGSLFSMVFAVTALILAAGCFTISNLLITQGIGRQGEMGLRLAVGATRARLLRQLLTECLILGGVGGTCGAILSLACAAGLQHFPLANTIGISLTTPATIDTAALVFAVGLTAMAVLIFGALPAALISTKSPVRGLATQAGHWASPRRSYARQSILAVQVALSVLLTVTAGLYATSLFRISNQRFPYDMNRIALARVNPTDLSASERQTFYAQLLQQLRVRGDVAGASLSANPLLAIGSAMTSPVAANRGRRSDFTLVGADYFKTLQVPMLEGREFVDHEQTPVAIINRTLAEQLWPGESPIGRAAYFPGLPPVGLPRTIVGMVEHPRCQDQLEMAERPCVYWPVQMDRATPLVLHVRTIGSPAAVLADLPKLAQRLNAAVVVDHVATLDEHLSAIRSGPRIAALMTGATALVTSLLSAVGCAALLLALIAEGRRDLAIRSAIGAPPTRLQIVMATHALRPYVAGLAVGAAGAWFLSTLVQDQLFQTRPHDPNGFAAPIVMLLLIGIGAAYWSTRRTRSLATSELLRA